MLYWKEYQGHIPDIQGKRNKYDNTIYTFDIETSSYLILNDKQIPACNYLDLSKKEKLGTRIKNIMNICVPLIFSTMDRIELISNAMDLRGFGKYKKRTWYSKKPLYRNDYLSMVFCVLVFAATICVSVFINNGRFWNPFM